jgi:hypothetical protein
VALGAAAAAKPLVAALRSAMSRGTWPPCEGPARALCVLVGDALKESEGLLTDTDYRKRWGALYRIVATAEGSEVSATRERLELTAAVGRTIDIAKQGFWVGLPWEADPATRSIDKHEWQTILPGTYVLSKLEDGWVYIAQGNQKYKIDLGDFRANWPDL